jgi:alpha-1,6-mannosyltransferase
MSSTTPADRAPAASSEIPPSAPAGLWPILAAGLLVEVVLLAGLTWPLRIWQPPDAITEPEPLSEMIGQSAAGLARFVLTLAVWCVCYGFVYHTSHRPPSPNARWALLLFPVLFVVTLAPTWPAASKDVYHYIFEGRALALHGENPLTTPPAEFPADPLRWIMSSWEWEPSRYGPLWALVAAVPAWLAGDNLRAVVLGFKAIGVASFLCTIACTHAAARRVRPDLALPAFVFVAWNPLLLFESAANAHNDILMLAFTALALLLAVRRDWTLAFPALAAAVLVKYLTGLLGPLLLLWAWRSTRGQPRERRRIVAGLGLAVWLMVACFAIFWTGAGTVGALAGAAGEALNSPGWLLRAALERLGLPETVAHLVVAAPLATAFLVVYALLLRRAWAAGSGFPAFLRYGLIALTVYLWTLSWWFWPWYVTWVLPVAALLAGRPVAFALLWSVAALAAYVPINFRPLFWGEPPDGRMPFAVTLTVFLPPALAALVLVVQRRRHPERGADHSSVTNPVAGSLSADR